MRNRFAVIFGFLSGFALLGVLIFAYLFLYHPNEITTSAQQKNRHEVVVIDFDGNGLTNQAELLNGVDAILAVDSTDKKNKAGLFNSTSGLLGLKLENRWITANDPAYKLLMLVFVTKAGEHRYESLAEAGIKAIRIDIKRLKGGVFTNDPLKSSLDNNNLVGEAILSNDKHSPIRLILIQ